MSSLQGFRCLSGGFLRVSAAALRPSTLPLPGHTAVAMGTAMRHFSGEAAGSSSSSSFDVFAKLKDPPDEGDVGKAKRKPSDKVVRLVDEIMSLTLIEAADLCDLCQDKLAPGDGAPIPGRMPFPHPMGMFPGGGMPGMMPQMGMPMAAAPAAAAPAAAAPAADAADDAPAEEKKEKKEEKKEFVTVKLVSFETSKKINVVKEVRAATALGLKEAKELVEGAPKTVKKGVPFADAEVMRDKLIAAGAEVVIE